MESNMTCGQMIKFSLSKLVVECFGTFMLTLFFYGNSQAIILSGLWILIVFAWKISGSHFNPAITLAYMFRRDSKVFPMSLGVSYIVVQILGAFLAGLILLFFTNNNVANMSVIKHCFVQYPDGAGNIVKTDTLYPCGSCFNYASGVSSCYDKTWYLRAMVQETLGAWITVLFFMI
jgi:glycerol uptake facilitator-like aquaporin